MPVPEGCTHAGGSCSCILPQTAGHIFECRARPPDAAGSSGHIDISIQFSEAHSSSTQQSLCWGLLSGWHRSAQGLFSWRVFCGRGCILHKPLQPGGIPAILKLHLIGLHPFQQAQPYQPVNQSGLPGQSPTGRLPSSRPLLVGSLELGLLGLVGLYFLACLLSSPLGCISLPPWGDGGILPSVPGSPPAFLGP